MRLHFHWLLPPPLASYWLPAAPPSSSVAPPPWLPGPGPRFPRAWVDPSWLPLSPSLQPACVTWLGWLEGAWLSAMCNHSNKEGIVQYIIQQCLPETSRNRSLTVTGDAKGLLVVHCRCTIALDAMSRAPSGTVRLTSAATAVSIGCSYSNHRVNNISSLEFQVYTDYKD